MSAPVTESDVLEDLDFDTEVACECPCHIPCGCRPPVTHRISPRLPSLIVPRLVCNSPCAWAWADAYGHFIDVQPIKS